MADLNKYEAAAGGEFGNGTAQQYGEADLRGRDFHGEDLRRSNFTAADCRSCNFKDAKLQGAYFIKSVVPNANFENANLSDVLMDRAVLNDANLRNANLQRTILTRSDLGGADIYGADFTNALVDKTQQIALCRYADGTNTETGVETRKSLGCGSRRKFRESSPSNPEGPQVAEDEKKAFVKSMPVYRQ
ncbi:g8963 [Coccomyxa elongata]